jgi:hypothetical protein
VPKQFLLNYLSALGKVGDLKQWSWNHDDKTLLKPPRALAQYLASRRLYGGVEVQPVLVPSGPGRDPVAGSLSFESGWGSLATGRYIVTLHQPSSVDLLDGIHAAVALLRQTIDNDDLILIPVEADDIPETRVFTSDVFDKFAHRRLPMHSAQTAPLILFSESASFGLHFDDFLWRMCDRLIQRPAYTRAALYFRSAIRHVYLMSGPIETYHDSFEEMPSRISEQVAIESSIQDCLKAVETLYGGMLARSENRVATRLRELGIDPTEICGFKRPHYKQGTIIEKLIALRALRDSSAAHGTSADERLNSLYELCDFQHLTSTVIWRAVAAGDENLLRGQPLVPPHQVDSGLMSPRVRRKLPKKVVWDR